MEYGALIGFHTFSVAAKEQAPIGESIDAGKFLTTALINYAEAMRVDSNFIVEALHTPAEDLLILKTAKHLRQLQIELRGYQEYRQMDKEAAILAANYATNWFRPLSSRGNESSSQATVTNLSTHDFKKRVLELLVERFDLYDRGNDARLVTILKDEIASRKDRDADRIYAEFLMINLLPYGAAFPSADIYHVEGFLFGARFYTVECFVWANGEADSIQSLNIFLISTTRDFEVKTFSKKGDILYELHGPDENVSGA